MSLSIRYKRQAAFPGLGENGQALLGAAKVAIVGCGGLGSTLASCMARAGVGNLTIIDRDSPDISNLHRQFLFDTSDVEKGANKALAATEKLRRVNPEIKICGLPERLSKKNCDKLLAGNDLVLDGTDNFETRYIINDWCLKNKVPWIYGGVDSSIGMTMVIKAVKGPCFRCLFPSRVAEDRPSDDPQRGIINTVPVVIASFQATEAFKLLTQSNDVIENLRIIDLWSGEFRTVQIERNPVCPCCSSEPSNMNTLPDK